VLPGIRALCELCSRLLIVVSISCIHICTSFCFLLIVHERKKKDNSNIKVEQIEEKEKLNLIPSSIIIYDYQQKSPNYTKIKKCQFC